jgi:hypothetical protein
VRKVFGFVKKNYPERSGGRAPQAEKGVRGKGRQPFSSPQHKETPASISSTVGYRYVRAAEPDLTSVACVQAIQEKFGSRFTAGAWSGRWRAKKNGASRRKVTIPDGAVEAYEGLRRQVVQADGRGEHLDGRGVLTRCGLAASYKVGGQSLNKIDPTQYLDYLAGATLSKTPPSYRQI